MKSNLVFLPQIPGWQSLAGEAERIAISLARRLPASEVASSDAMLERQIAVLLSGLASRSQRHKGGNKWGFFKKFAFKYALRISLKRLGYADAFSNMASQRITNF
jgi:hypothetical protein